MDNGAIRKSLTRGPVPYFLLFLAVFCCLGVANPKVFLGQYNLQSMACQVPEFGILALGMMVAIITGGIDLSIISNAILSGVVASLAMYKYLAASGERQSAFMVMLVISAACAASGLVLGLFNGFLVSFMKIPAILATLGTMKLYDGISTVITDGQPLRNYPAVVSRLANDNVILAPASFYLFLAACFLLWIVMEKTKTGQEIYFYGESPKASRYSGLDNNLTLLKAYGLCGVMAGLSGLVMMSRFNSVKVGYGSTYLLLTVLVAIMGGVHPNGGRGNVLCVAFSVLTLQCIASGFNILDFSNYVRNIIYGVVLILVMVLYVVHPVIVNRRALKMRRETVEG